MDKFSLQQWHANMAAIRSKDTRQEMIVRMKSAGKGRDEGGFEDGSRREGTGHCGWKPQGREGTRGRCCGWLLRIHQTMCSHQLLVRAVCA